MNMPRLYAIATVATLLFAVAACQQSQSTSGGPTAQAPTSNIQHRIDASTYFAHGHLLERQGNLPRAIEQYDLALQVNPEFTAARNRLGIVLNKQGHHAEATEHFRQAVAESPHQAHLVNNLGFSLFLQGDYAAALPQFQRALDLSPDFGRAQMNRGLTLGKLGRYDEALAAFEQVCSAADAYYNLAMLQTEGGHYVDAVKSLDQALTLNPSLEPARQQMHTVARLAAQQEAAQAEVTAVPPVVTTGPVDSDAPVVADATPNDLDAANAAPAPIDASVSAPANPDRVAVADTPASAQDVAPVEPGPAATTPAETNNVADVQEPTNVPDYVRNLAEIKANPPKAPLQLQRTYGGGTLIPPGLKPDTVDPADAAATAELYRQMIISQLTLEAMVTLPPAYTATDPLAALEPRPIIHQWVEIWRGVRPAPVWSQWATRAD